MSPFNPSTANKLARTLKALHIPGHPVVFTNIWDAPSASLALSQPKTKALATASYAVAAVNGLNDEDLTLEANLACISKIAARIAKEGRADSIPLSVDLQDGYGNRLPEAVEAIIDLGAVGISLEDSKSVNGKMELITAEEHVQRIGQVLQIAAKKGVPDFVINARTDAIVLGGTIEEAIERGKKYLEARATTVFVWGGSARGLRDVEVEQLVQGLDGRLNVMYRKGRENALSIEEIAKIGVARVSMGPALWVAGMSAIEKELGTILGGAK